MVVVAAAEVIAAVSFGGVSGSPPSAASVAPAIGAQRHMAESGICSDRCSGRYLRVRWRFL